MVGSKVAQKTRDPDLAFFAICNRGVHHAVHRCTLTSCHSIEPAACKISDAIISQLDFLGFFQKRKLTDAVFPPKRPSRSSVQRCPCVISRYNILNHSAVLNVKVALVYWIDLFVARCDRLVRRLEVSRLILSDKWGK